MQFWHNALNSELFNEGELSDSQYWHFFRIPYWNFPRNASISKSLLVEVGNELRLRKGNNINSSYSSLEEIPSRNLHGCNCIWSLYTCIWYSYELGNATKYDGHNKICTRISGSLQQQDFGVVQIFKAIHTPRFELQTCKINISLRPINGNNSCVQVDCVSWEQLYFVISVCFF